MPRSAYVKSRIWTVPWRRAKALSWLPKIVWHLDGTMHVTAKKWQKVFSSEQKWQIHTKTLQIMAIFCISPLKWEEQPTQQVPKILFRIRFNIKLGLIKTPMGKLFLWIGWFTSITTSKTFQMNMELTANFTKIISKFQMKWICLKIFNVCNIRLYKNFKEVNSVVSNLMAIRWVMKLRLIIPIRKQL